AAKAMVRSGRQVVDHSRRRVIWAHPVAGPAMTHRSGSAAANRVAWRSQDAADSGQVTVQLTLPPAGWMRRAKPAAALVAARDLPLPIAMARAPRLRASSVMRLSSASVASVSAVSPATPGGISGEAVL